LSLVDNAVIDCVDRGPKQSGRHTRKFRVWRPLKDGDLGWTGKVKDKLGVATRCRYVLHVCTFHSTDPDCLVMSN